MLTREEIQAKLEDCNKDYLAGKLGSYKNYKRKYDAIRNLNSITNQIKRLGGKVTRSKELMSTYIYHGKNFTVELTEASCETTWWEVCIHGENVAKEVFDCYWNEDNMFENKRECLYSLLRLDQELSN